MLMEYKLKNVQVQIATGMIMDYGIAIVAGVSIQGIFTLGTCMQ